MNKVKCIYAIKDKRSDKVIYVGQTVNFKKRKEHHLYDNNRPIDIYIVQQHRENFDIYILEELPKDLSKEEMRNREQYYIDFYDTYNNGFNMRQSGNISLFNVQEYNKERNKKWYENNRIYVNERARQYRENNREKYDEYQREYQRQYRLKKKQEKLKEQEL